MPPKTRKPAAKRDRSAGAAKRENEASKKAAKPETKKKVEFEGEDPAQQQQQQEEEVAAPDLVGDLSFRRSTTAKVATNKQKCLVLGSRSMSTKDRHVLNDLQGLMPHARAHSKLDSRDNVGDGLQELTNLHHCNSTLFIEARRRQTAFLWLGQAPNGPSVKMELLNIHTADELRMVGNCLKYSRPMLHFDKEFDNVPHLRIIKSLLQMTFNTPRYHPLSKPFVDHILCMFYLDGKIWFRNYQIREEGKEPALTEIGPRFVLDPHTILDGCCKGSVLWRNEEAMSPTQKRLSRKVHALNKMQENERVKEKSETHRKENPAPAPHPLGKVFHEEDGY